MMPSGESVGLSRHRQQISFDRGAIDASIGYLKNRTNGNFEGIISTPGGKLAYRHHLWSSISSRLAIREFWKKQLEGLQWSQQLETAITDIIQYLSDRKRDWLPATLRYVPRGHVFNSTIYLIGGYDNIVYGEDVALNLNFKKFQADHREAVYYLIHELAHAGYFRYRRMPNLVNLKTLRDLLNSVRLLTHLEGMGVISPFKLRMKEGGLSDCGLQSPAEPRGKRGKGPRLLLKTVEPGGCSEPKTGQRGLSDSRRLQLSTQTPMVHNEGPHGLEN